MRIKSRTKKVAADVRPRVSAKERRKMRAKLRLAPWDGFPDDDDKQRSPVKWLSVRQVAESLDMTELLAAACLRRGHIPGSAVSVDGDLLCEAETFADWMAIERGRLDYKLPWAEPLVYFVQQENAPTAPIKIGVTTRDGLHARLSSLQTGNPNKLKILATMRGDVRDEARLHESFKHARVSGEWFRPTEGLLALIGGLVKCV